jgi:hypothetical protein
LIYNAPSITTTADPHSVNVEVDTESVTITDTIHYEHFKSNIEYKIVTKVMYGNEELYAQTSDMELNNSGNVVITLTMPTRKVHEI